MGEEWVNSKVRFFGFAGFVLRVASSHPPFACLAGAPGDSHVCELQKLYIASEHRGRGVAKQLMRECVAFAASTAHSEIYLETLPNMVAAQALYRAFGFVPCERMGGTGHTLCTVRMRLQIK